MDSSAPILVRWRDTQFHDVCDPQAGDSRMCHGALAALSALATVIGVPDASCANGVAAGVKADSYDAIDGRQREAARGCWRG